MARRSGETDRLFRLPADDDLGDLIRMGLQDSVGKAEPPVHVWPRILERVRQKTAPAAPRRVRRRLPVASLVQAVVISSLVLAFGLGLDREVVVRRRANPTVSAAIVRIAAVLPERPTDALSGHLLLLMKKQPTSRGHVGGYAP